ncbi:MAG TPA: PLP-dependent aminotransferase family protein [Acetobacteraceae bacterium]|nr:PLP-dependent aminotransferase family protein [Acetobacteraceae bacterium]
MAPFPLELDRAGRTPLAAQIYGAIREAIVTGRLVPGSKLPSWRDLAIQLGVSRGTVRVAYERLINEELAIGKGAAGTRVAQSPPRSAIAHVTSEAPPLPKLFFYGFGAAPLAFQMGVPSQDAFPCKLWSRILSRAARQAAVAPVAYPDPRGEPDLRNEIAAYLGITRGIRCHPSQVLVTAGLTSALCLAVRGLQLDGSTAWMEEPGFPITRSALGLTGMTVAAIPVDPEGLDVAAGIRSAPEAALAVATPGQQAPLGMTMSTPRRLALIAWARRNDAWIIEDDYLSELQLEGRAAPALASLDSGGRVLHIGSFSKTISPTLRLGFLVVPPEHARRFGELAACLAPAPSAPVQHAVAVFLREGHYLRHLRHMKRLYAARRAALLRCLEELASDSLRVTAMAGLAVVTHLPESVSDVAVASRALSFGLAPSPLSSWYMQAASPQGLLLCVTNLNEQRLPAECHKLAELVR